MIVSVCSFFLPVFFYFCFFSSSIFYSFFILLFLLLLLSTSRVYYPAYLRSTLHYTTLTTFTTQFNSFNLYTRIGYTDISRSFPPNPSDVTQASLNQRTADQSALKYITNISQTILYTSYTLRRL